MLEVPEIKDFAKMIEPHLNGGKLISYTSKYLTKPGDNYGSLMISITANIQNKNGVTEEVPMVAKLPPLTNEMYWNIFQPEITCISENAVYKYVSPAVRELQQNAGINEAELFDGFSRSFGSRISLNDKATRVDRSAVLVLENLQVSGYKAGNRHKLYDLAHTKLALKYLAQWHALPIGLRLKAPAVFESDVRPYFGRLNINDGITLEAKEEMAEGILKQVECAVPNSEKVIARMKECDQIYDQFVAEKVTEDTMFTSLMHNDLWINNFMFKYENDAPTKLKIVDYQMTQYESLAHDIFFFLFTSVESSLLEANYEKFLKIYLEEFCKSLESVGVDASEYTFQSLLDEMKRVAPIQLSHVLLLTKVILADNSQMPDDFKDLGLDVISKNNEQTEITRKYADIIHIMQKYNLFY